MVSWEKRLCIKCDSILEVVKGEKNKILYCNNNKCDRYGFLTILFKIKIMKTTSCGMSEII